MENSHNQVGSQHNQGTLPPHFVFVFLLFPPLFIVGLKIKREEGLTKIQPREGWGRAETNFARTTWPFSPPFSPVKIVCADLLKTHHLLVLCIARGLAEQACRRKGIGVN